MGKSGTDECFLDGISFYLGVAALRLTFGDRDRTGDRAMFLRQYLELLIGLLPGVMTGEGVFILTGDGGVKTGEGVFIRTGNRAAFVGVVSAEVLALDRFIVLARLVFGFFHLDM